MWLNDKIKLNTVISCKCKYILEFLMVFISILYIFSSAFRYVIPLSSAYQVIKILLLCLLLIGFVCLGSIAFKIGSIRKVMPFVKNYLSIEQFLLIGLSICFVCSCYVNQLRWDYDFLKIEETIIIDTIILCCIIFPLTKAIKRERLKTTLEIIIHTIVIPYSVFAIVCLWHIFNLEVIDLPSGEQAGITVSMQLMLGYHYNITGMISVTILVVCLIMTVNSNGIIRSLYILFAVVHLLVVYLSNSRAVFLGLFVFVVSASFLITYFCLKVKRPIKKIMLSLLISVIVGFLYWQGRYFVFNVFERITNFSENINNISEEQLLFKIDSYKPVQLSRKVQSDKIYMSLASYNKQVGARSLSGLGGRPNVWLSAVRTMIDSWFNFFFGVTPIMVPDQLVNTGGYWDDIAHAHNIFLQVGVSMGVPAMLLFTLFVIRVLYRCFRLLFQNQKKVTTLFIVSGIFCFLVINLVEPYLFAYFSLISCVFFLFAGYIVLIDEKAVESLQSTNKKKIRNSYLLLLVGVVFLGAVTCFVLYKGDQIKIIFGKGTIDDPYKIEDKEDLDYFRDLVNAGCRFEDKYVKQMSDIDLMNEEWIPIGLYHSGNYFAGSYNGNYHCIYNIKIENYKGSPKNVGFFGALEGAVLNLGIESGSIKGDHVGAIASHSYGNNALIYNCYNKADIIGKIRAGGIADNFTGGIIINSLCEGKINAPISSEIISYNADMISASSDYVAPETFNGFVIPVDYSGDNIYDKLDSGLLELTKYRFVKHYDNNMLWSSRKA